MRFSAAAMRSHAVPQRSRRAVRALTWRPLSLCAIRDRGGSVHQRDGAA